MTRGVVAFIDPYWLLGRVASPAGAMLRAVAKAAGSDARLARVTLRSAPCDDLDDGYELVRAMEADIRSLADSRTFDELFGDTLGGSCCVR